MPYKKEVAILICIYTHIKDPPLFESLYQTNIIPVLTTLEKKTNPNYIPEIKKIV